MNDYTEPFTHRLVANHPRTMVDYATSGQEAHFVSLGARIQPWRTLLRQSGRALTTSEPIVG